ncbi:MAG: hypothetical protein Q4Q03_03320, partial [Bowdeniella nasicola]|nr:hypothetical protein [Bowdeniella nasicola]
QKETSGQRSICPSEFMAGSSEFHIALPTLLLLGWCAIGAPNGGQYRPITAYQAGSIVDALSR